MKHPRSKKLKRIAEAVFRGKKSQYSFDVFPITNDIEDSPAVYIFSRRQLDKFGHGHHFVSCIGETDSVLAEVKRHKRNKCVKQNESNVVCILREDNEAKRAGMIDDLKANRSFICPHDADKSKMRPAKPYVEIVRPAKTTFDLTLSKRRTHAKKVAEPVLVVSESVASRSRTVKAKKSKKRTTKTVAAVVATSSKKRTATVKDAPVAKAKPAAKRTSVKPARVVAAPAKRASTKSVTAAAPAPKRATAKPASNGAAKPKSKAKRADAKSTTRVPSSVDSDGRQHRLPKPEKPVSRRAKKRTAGRSRSRTKIAA